VTSNTASSLVARLRAALTAALGSGDRTAAAAEYDRLGHGGQAERLRREADVLVAVLGPDYRDARPAR